MSAKKIFVLAGFPLIIFGVLGYYWFDVGGKISAQPLQTIPAENQSKTYSVSEQNMKKDVLPKNTKYAYLAGGCFWCVEKDLEKLAGVAEVVSGYSGGQSPNPTYQNHADHRETVQVHYDPEKISYSQILHHFFRHHDPTDAGGSFYDRGHSYTSAIYFQTAAEEKIAREIKTELDASGIFAAPIVTAIEPLGTFTIAEEYHQNYYKKNPVSAAKYRTYRKASGRDKFIDSVAARESAAGKKSENNHWENYQKPADEVLKKSLTPLQYRVTQQDGTEKPFSEGNLNDEKRAGIFVDILSGEPLFSSRDKFESGTGWPSFTRPIDAKFITTKTDYWLIYPRTEVRSKFGKNHLGHVFNDGPQMQNGQKSTGQRWCINGAALRFIPLEQMEETGYGAYLNQVDK